MGRAVASAMTFEKDRLVPSKRSVVEQGMFKDMATSNILWGVTKELYRRFDTELYMVITFVTYAVIIYHKLGL